MSGAVILLPINVFMVWAGATYCLFFKNLLFYLPISIIMHFLCEIYSMCQKSA